MLMFVHINQIFTVNILYTPAEGILVLGRSL